MNTKLHGSRVTLAAPGPFARLAPGLLALVACGGRIVLDERGAGGGAGGGGAGGGVEAGSTVDVGVTGATGSPPGCDLQPGPLTLVPAPDNPPGCEGAMTCEVWFGHGQHLSCPGLLSQAPHLVTCQLDECVCQPYPPDGFVASFETGEVVDARDPDRTCRYTLQAE